MKNRKGFTLIELLAVIIILGILMIIAIPSVTKYIGDTRKSGYVNIAKNIAGGARNLIHSGKYDFTNEDTTYYVDGRCIKTENNYKSPYGEFIKSYVAITFSGNQYDYYWTSVDDSNTGVERLLNIEKMNNDYIKSDINPNEVLPNVGIDNRQKVVIVGGDSCTASEPIEAERFLNSRTLRYKGECPDVTETIYWALQDTNGDDINDKLILSSSAVTGALNGSFPGDSYFSTSSEVPWYTSSGLSKQVDKIEILGEIIPLNIKYWFYNLGLNASSISVDLNNIETCNITRMDNSFNGFGAHSTDVTLNISDWDVSNVTSFYETFRNFAQDSSKIKLDISNWDTSSATSMVQMFAYSCTKTTNYVILGIEKLNTSNLKNMASIFENAFRKSSSINVNNWNTSQVTKMSRAFYGFGEDSSSIELDLSKWDTSNVTNMSEMFNTSGYRATPYYLNISGWDMSKVTNVSNMFSLAGKYSNVYNVIIPPTNGNGISNTSSILYGKTSSTTTSPESGKSFTLAN